MFSIIGFSILAVMTLILFALTFTGTYITHGITWLLLLQVLFFLSLVYEDYRLKIKDFTEMKIKESSFERDDVYNFLAVVLCALITYVFSYHLEMGPVVASGLVGIMAALIISKHTVAAFCGSFVGMACNTLLINHWYVLLAGIIAGLVFVFSKNVFKGFGGKLGTIAFTGCVWAALITRRGFTGDSIVNWDTGKYLLIYSVLAAVITYILNVRLNNSAVISSGAVGVSAGLIMPVIYPQMGAIIAVMMYCASFAGMANLERIPNEIYMVITGILCALFFIYSAPYLGGAGGKLGTIAFASCIIMRGFLDFGDFVKENWSESLLEKSMFTNKHESQ